MSAGKIAYSRPDDFVVTLVGTGAMFETDESDLFNGRPADPTRLMLPSTWSGVITEYVEIQFMRATAFVPGLVGLFGLNALGLASSAGIKFTFMGRRAADSGFTYSLGGNTALVRSYQYYDGSIRALGICDDGLDPIIGYSMRIYNDQNGIANMVASAFVDLGDAWGSPTSPFQITKGWEIDEQADNVPTSPNEQPWPTPFPPSPTVPFTISQQQFSDVFLSTRSPNFRQFIRLLGNGNSTVFVPLYKNAAGAIDWETLHATAMFGTCKFNKTSHISGPIYSQSGTLTNVPALLAE